MKKIYLFILLLIVLSGCESKPARTGITGNWQSEDGKTSLKITTKEFILNEGGEPIAESYFVKGDTIFTSYQGSQPYTKFGFRNLADHTFTLIFPDSAEVNFKR